MAKKDYMKKDPVSSLSENKREKKQKDNQVRVYFDWAASSPYQEVSGDVPYGNPSSQHSEGRSAKQLLEDARNRCAAVLNVPPKTLYFTSGGTESNSIALFSNLMRPGKGRVISSLTEHASVRGGIETLEKMGKLTGFIPVDSAGRVTAESFSKTLEKYGDVRFAAIMSVNNETGAVTDIASIRDVINQKGENSRLPIHLHCDLVQAAGKIPLNITDLEIDSASISAHKIGGPRGIGLLYLRKPLEVFYSGGGQENGIRGGTENTRGAIALADCLEKYAMSAVSNELGFIDAQSKITREHFFTVQDYYSLAKKRWEKLISALNEIKRCTIIPAERAKDNASLKHQVSALTGFYDNDGFNGFSPYILQVAFNDIPGEVMARALDDLGIAVSTGSACSASSPERPVLAAMGINEKLRIEGIRISQGQSTTDREIDLLLDAIREVLKFL